MYCLCFSLGLWMMYDVARFKPATSFNRPFTCLRGIILSFCLMVASSIAYSQNTFEKFYPEKGYQEGISVVQGDNGDYIVVGAGAREDLRSSIYLMRINSHGDVLKTQMYDETGEGFGHDVQKAPGGYVITGVNSMGLVMLKVNATGDPLWNKSSGKSRNGQAVATCDGGGFIFGGYAFDSYNNTKDAYVVRTDENGDILWEKTYGSPQKEESINAILQADDGGFMALGSTDEFGINGLYTDILLLKLDDAGNIVWKKIIGSQDQEVGRDLKRTSDGAYIAVSYVGGLGANLSVMKFTSAGEVIWEKQFGAKVLSLPFSIVQTNDKGFLITGESYAVDLSDRHTYLLKISESADSLWMRFFWQEGFSRGQGLTVTKDGNFALTGRRSVKTGDTDVFLIKVNEDGCVSPLLDLGDDLVRCAGDQLKLDAGSGFTNYLWNEKTEGQTLTVTTTGTYRIKATDSRNCTVSDSIQVEFKNCDVLDVCNNKYYSFEEFFLPNIITPNNDGFNDVFVVSEELKGASLRIYNRWGTLVYLNQSYQNNWEGEDLGDGTYYFSLNKPCLNKSFKGWIQVSR